MANVNIELNWILFVNQSRLFCAVWRSNMNLEAFFFSSRTPFHLKIALFSFTCLPNSQINRFFESVQFEQASLPFKSAAAAAAISAAF